MECKPGIFQSLGTSRGTKLLLFYGICIWVRLYIAYLSHQYQAEYWFKYVAVILSLFSVLSIGNDSCVWWSRTFHSMIAGLIFISAVLDQNKFVPYLLVVDVLFGFTYSIGRL